MLRTQIVYFLTSTALLGAFHARASHAATIETVPIGNPGNPNDPSDGNNGADGIQHYGSVAYSYRMGSYEVSNAQYVEFLNMTDPTGANALALYNENMTTDARGGVIFNADAPNGFKYEFKPGRKNNPVVYVSWADSIRFANWLHNGQGDGNTEDGAYTILNGGTLPSINDVVRNSGAKWFLPSEDEWYKAAYYDPRTAAHGGPPGDDHYWRLPTQVDSVADIYSDNPAGLNTPEPSSSANFRKNDGIANGYSDGYAVTGSDEFSDSQNYLTNVGAYNLATSYYGTFDQAGNVREWTEASYPGILAQFRVVRGGSWNSSDGFELAAFNRTEQSALGGRNYTGFRVATLVPEPSIGTLVLIGITIATIYRRRLVE